MRQLMKISLWPIALCLSVGTASASQDAASYAWGDYDGDSLADLFLWTPSAPGKLLRNLGDGGFQDVTSAVGLDPGRRSIDASFADYDGDGDPDLLLLSGSGPVQLFENVGGVFRDATTAQGLLHRGTDLVAAWSDFDQDGRLDLLVSQAASTLVYHNGPDGSFTQVALVDLAPTASSPSTTLVVERVSGSDSEAASGAAPSRTRLFWPVSTIAAATSSPIV